MKLLANLPIRWRITLGSVGIAIVLLAPLALLIDARVHGVLRSANETVLEEVTDPIVASIGTGATASLPQARGEPGVVVIDPSGRVVLRSIPRELAGQVLRAGTPARDETRDLTARGDEYIVLVRPVSTADGTWVVAAARSERSSEIVSEQLDATIAMASGVLLVLEAAAAWLLSSAALRPVRRMQRRAVALRAEGSDGLLPLGPARDELTDLATTLNELIAELRASAERERQMVSDASHELRTPLAVLRTQLELARLSAGDATALLAEITAAEGHVDRLIRLTDDLLALSRIATEPPSRSRWGELVDELRDAVDRWRLVAASRGVRIEYGDGEEGSPAGSVEIGPWDFARILDNLIGNATAAVPDGGTVLVRLEDARDRWRLLVEDDGPGMPPAFVPVAFDRFTRPDVARSADRGGSGLGLSIVAALARSAGGSARIDNRPGEGVTVVVELPVR